MIKDYNFPSCMLISAIAVFADKENLYISTDSVKQNSQAVARLPVWYGCFLNIYPFKALMAAVSFGTTSKASPTIP